MHFIIFFGVILHWNENKVPLNIFNCHAYIHLKNIGHNGTLNFHLDSNNRNYNYAIYNCTYKGNYVYFWKPQLYCDNWCKPLTLLFHNHVISAEENGSLGKYIIICINLMKLSWHRGYRHNPSQNNLASFNSNFCNYPTL